jgi:2-iminobutanoate/2-iminopropanoate deaminase
LTTKPQCETFLRSTTINEQEAQMSKFKIALMATTGLALAGMAHSAEYLGKSDFQQMRAYSPAVLTRGGTTIWLAGQTSSVSKGVAVDADGKDITGNFEAQTRRTFALIDQTLKQQGASLANLVTMTVFIKESRYGDEFVKLRKEIFPGSNYPASTLITVSSFAQPGLEIEIQGVAVVNDECSDAKPCGKH